jgi:hypothetical protein
MSQRTSGWRGQAEKETDGACIRFHAKITGMQRSAGDAKIKDLRRTLSHIRAPRASWVSELF